MHFDLYFVGQNACRYIWRFMHRLQIQHPIEILLGALQGAQYVYILMGRLARRPKRYFTQGPVSVDSATCVLAAYQRDR